MEGFVVVCLLGVDVRYCLPVTVHSVGCEVLLVGDR